MDKLQEKAGIDLAKVDEIIARYRGQKWALIPLLQDIQEEFGYIHPQFIPSVAEALSLFPSQVQGVITFYEQFHTMPRGKNIVRVCRGTACHVRGGKTILKLVKQNLGIGEGENTPDLEFTLETVPCLGTCFLAPVMMVNKDYFGNLTPPNVKSVLQGYKKS